VPVIGQSGEQAFVNIIEAAVAHYQHGIAGLRRRGDSVDQPINAAGDYGALAKRGKRTFEIPLQRLWPMDKDSVGLLQRSSKRIAMHAKPHGIGARLDHRQDTAPMTRGQGGDCGGDRGRVMSEVIVHPYSADRSAQLEPAAYPAKVAQRLNTPVERNTGVAGGEKGGQDVAGVVLTGQRQGGRSALSFSG
jgi:hypothetical protein